MNFHNLDPTLVFDIYQYTEHSKNPKIFLYQTKSLFNTKFNMIYPTQNAIYTKYTGIKVISQYQEKHQLFIESFFSNTLLLVSMDANLNDFKLSIGTICNCIYNNVNKRMIISSYSLIKEYSDYLYSLNVSAISNLEIYNFISSLYYIVNIEENVEEKKVRLSKLITLYKNVLNDIIQDDYYLKIRKRYINYLQSDSTYIHFKNPLTNKNTSPLLDVAVYSFSTPSDNSLFKQPIEINLGKTLTSSGGIMTIVPIPFIELYSNIRQFIDNDEDYFYNYIKLFDENELSLVYGKINCNFNSINNIGVGYYYKKFNISGELLIDTETFLPLGIGFISDDHTSNYYFYENQSDKEYNAFIPFSHEGFNAVMKVYLGIENGFLFETEIISSNDVDQADNENSTNNKEEKGKRFKKELTLNFLDFDEEEKLFFDVNSNQNSYQGACFFEDLFEARNEDTTNLVKKQLKFSFMKPDSN